jgi:hypothetical protein
MFGCEGSQAVPARPSGKIRLKKSSEVEKVERSGARREVKRGLTAFDWNFEF